MRCCSASCRVDDADDVDVDDVDVNDVDGVGVSCMCVESVVCV